MKKYFVYILTTKFNKIFYTGVTNNLTRRIYEHKNKLVAEFTSKYNISKLVYYEEYNDVRIAIERERQIKDFRVGKKRAIIANTNPLLRDLYGDII